MVFPLANTGYDHVPCVINIDTNIPKAKIFRFENYWVDMPGFQECVASSWAKISSKSYSSAIVADKLKSLRYDLRKWHTSLSKIEDLIQNCNKVILAFDTLEEIRPLYKPEFNFRKIIKLHLDDLLMVECNYWRKRCTIRWIKQGKIILNSFMLWPLKDLGGTILPCSEQKMVEKLLTIMRWLVCFGLVTRLVWVSLMASICNLICRFF
jgi:hypothetical protein